MEDQIVEFIVNEVMRRISAPRNTHKGLLILTQNTDMVLLKIIIDSMIRQEFMMDCIYLKDIKKDLKENSYFKDMRIIKTIVKENTDFDFRELVEEYEVLLVSNLNLKELSFIRDLKIENEFLSLIYEGLKQGSIVYSLSKDLEINPRNKGLIKRINLLIRELDELGLKLVTKIKEERISMDKDLITIADVNKIETGPILVKRSAVITSSARDYMKEVGIEILRR